MSITNLEIQKKKGEEYACSFIINDQAVSLCNSLRRVILSNIPNASFSDDTNSDGIRSSIVIKKNDSVLHNELLAQRIGLIPICLYKNDVLKIHTKWDYITNKRVYSFINPPPKFNLKVINNASERNQLALINKNASHDILTVTSERFTVDNGNPQEFFISDYFTGDYPIINKLKSEKIVNNSEQIDIDCTPTCGIGFEHTRYTSVGTVSYEFLNDQEKIDETRTKYIEHIKNERKNKNLEALTDREMTDIEKSFDILDKDRVYKKNKYNEANSIKFNIESVGNFKPHKIFTNALRMLHMMLNDILKCIKIKDNSDFEINKDKIVLEQNTKNEFTFKIFNENHTLGNLISDFGKMIYLVDSDIKSDSDDNDLITFVAYKMPHPLKSEVEIKYRVNQESKLKEFVNDNINILGLSIDVESIDPNHLNKLVVLIAFIKTINIIISKIKEIETDYISRLNENGLNELITFTHDDFSETFVQI